MQLLEFQLVEFQSNSTLNAPRSFKVLLLERFQRYASWSASNDIYAMHASATVQNDVYVGNDSNLG